MQCLIVLCILCVLSTASRTWASPQVITQSQVENRIAFGKEFNSEDHPYVVFISSLLDTGSNSKSWTVCTGTLITPEYVLTAAHCFPSTKKPSDYTVQLGFFVGASSKPLEIYTHPKHGVNQVADLSIMKLMKPLPVSRYITISGHPDDFADGKEMNCVNIGYGSTETDDHPKHGLIINVTIRYKERCFHKNDPVLGKEFLCAKIELQRPCHGDSGGPLICNGFQYAVVSKNVRYMDDKGNSTHVSGNSCGTPIDEDEFLFLYNYQDWIMDCISSCPIIRPDTFCIFISFYLIVILFTFLECI